MIYDKDRKTEVVDDRKTEIVDDRSTEVMDDRSTIYLGDDFNNPRAPINVDAILGEDVGDGYILKNVISCRSGQSIVYLATNKNDNKNYVCKLYRNEATIIDEDVINILKNKIDSPYVIKVITCGYYKGRYYTITPYYEEGSVIEHLEEVDSNKLKYKYIPQLNEALHTIHKAGIFHCDIKPHNIYFTDGGETLVIGDFGIALPLDKYPTKNTSYGEVIPKRELQRNNATKAYLSVEGDEYASERVDYYALGLTILNMANQKDVYEGMSDKDVRDELIGRGPRIPNNVDREVAMLIYKMTDIAPARRIGYEGVAKWCRNTSIYGQYTFEDTDKDCLFHFESCVFMGITYNSTFDYTNAMFNNIDEAKNYYMRNGIEDDIARRSTADVEQTKLIYNIKRKYESDIESGLVLTLMTLNPTLPFYDRGKGYSDFKGFIAYLDSCSSYGDVFYNEEIIIKEINNEVSQGKIKNAEPIITICNNIFKSSYGRDYKLELLRNYFTSMDDIVINYTHYSLPELSTLMFLDNIIPNSCPLIFNQLFMNMLLERFDSLKEHRKKLLGLVFMSDALVKNAGFSLILTGVVRAQIEGRKIDSILDVVNYAKDLYENNLDFSKLCELLKNGTILRYYDVFPKKDAKMVSLLNYLMTSKYTGHELLTLFYMNTQEHAIFCFNGQKFSDIKELITYLSKRSDLEKISSDLINSNEFQMWLGSRGYGSALTVLGR